MQINKCLLNSNKSACLCCNKPQPVYKKKLKKYFNYTATALARPKLVNVIELRVMYIKSKVLFI